MVATATSPAAASLTVVRERVADRVRGGLHDALFRGQVDRPLAQSMFRVLVACMGPQWPQRPVQSLRLELLRSALGDGEQAIVRLEALYARQRSERLQREVMVGLLELCQVHDDVVRGWNHFARFEREHLAVATPDQVFAFHRHRCALRTKVGVLDAADAALQAAKAAFGRLPEAARSADKVQSLRANELDLWLAAERFAEAEAVAAELAASAPANSFAARRVELARSLIQVRTGHDA
ncbi:MAG: hypothetical protein JNK15_24735, partial [Planctomycetes bacterium]|nr:hypothetical protein [Planctomycetota bacterium]